MTTPYQEPIRCVPVWSGWLRLSHWVIAVGVLFQALSAWALDMGATDPRFWHEWHVIVGQVVLLALLLRGGLLFMPGSSHWRALLPSGRQGAAMLQMLKFYLSFARFPLPDWYAHNPLWQPVYALLLLVLLACAATGLLIENSAAAVILGWSTRKVHAFLSWIILSFSAAHVIAAMLHDWKGKGASISAMFSGSRYFHISGGSDLRGRSAGLPPEVSVSVDSLARKSRGRHDDPS